jgi:hypothetical protein
MGNGQPGRISLLESTVSKLASWRWYVLGTACGVGSVISALAYIFVEVKK